MGPGHVDVVGLPDRPDAQIGDPSPRTGQVLDLEDRHVPAVTAPSIEIPPGGGVGAHRGHDLNEGIAHRQHCVAQTEHADTGVDEGLLGELEHRTERVHHGAEVVRDQRNLA
jgi:hypothetical protein